MIKKRKKDPSGCRRRDRLSSRNDQHIEDWNTTLNTFRIFPKFKELLIIPTASFIIANYLDTKTFQTTIILSLLFILLILQFITHILIQYKNLKTVFRSITLR